MTDYFRNPDVVFGGHHYLLNKIITLLSNNGFTNILGEKENLTKKERIFLNNLLNTCGSTITETATSNITLEEHVNKYHIVKAGIDTTIVDICKRLECKNTVGVLEIENIYYICYIDEKENRHGMIISLISYNDTKLEILDPCSNKSLTVPIERIEGLRKIY
ncbi:MAG: hypothetical protein GY804_08780 [Alphaproteobacteria bacterium]|nr:hypothetical protein [Alphaproteobacteria bacterium]